MFDSLLQPNPEDVLKVTQLTRLIKGQLEERFARVWVKGEISNLRKQSSGHIYFSLKDAGSQVPCALFARDAAQQSFELQDGMEVVLMGDISVYEPYGRYQLIAKVAIQSGEGRLQIEFERLKRKLAAEGLFHSDKKQSLPSLPSKIAVITSPTGAAVRDFLRILKRRNYRGEVVIFPAKVQGQGAASEMISMLKHAAASPNFDCIVLTRGGGSIEDLWAFNEEALARAVAACPLPTISAIGHEIDTVLTDYAADQRAETPSGAAELLSSLYLDAEQRIDQANENLHYWIDLGISERQRALADLVARMRIIAPERQIEYLGMRLDDFENKLSRRLNNKIAQHKECLSQHAQSLAMRHPKAQIGIAKQRLTEDAGRLKRSVQVRSTQQTDRLQQLQHRLDNSSLNATLKRGFALVKKADGSIIERANEAKQEPRLTVKLYDGEISLKNEK